MDAGGVQGTLQFEHAGGAKHPVEQLQSARQGGSERAAHLWAQRADEDT